MLYYLCNFTSIICVNLPTFFTVVEPEEYTCPISIINTTKESVEITTPLVTVDEIRVSNRASILALQKAKSENYESIQERKENLRQQLRLEHSNKEEKRAVEKI